MVTPPPVTSSAGDSSAIATKVWAPAREIVTLSGCGKVGASR